MMSLVSCATQPETRIAAPNEALYKSDVPVPELKENATNADLARWGQALVKALGIANADRASLREWASQIGEHNEHRKPHDR